MKDIEPDEILDIAVRAGVQILENGGETYRSEETIIYIAESLGAINPAAFVTPTVVIFSYEDENRRHYSTMRRLKGRGVNLRKVAQVNTLSRRLSSRDKPTNPVQIESLLDRIERMPANPSWAIVLMAAASSLFFALMFGGGLREAAAAFCIGALLRIFLVSIAWLRISSFITSLLSGSFVSIMSQLAQKVHFVDSAGLVSISVLMLVVPGIAIVNAIRDIIAGDLVSGNARLTEAFMIATGLSIGSAFALLIMSGSLL